MSFIGACFNDQATRTASIVGHLSVPPEVQQNDGDDRSSARYRRSTRSRRTAEKGQIAHCTKQTYQQISKPALFAFLGF